MGKNLIIVKSLLSMVLNLKEKPSSHKLWVYSSYKCFELFFLGGDELIPQPLIFQRLFFFVPVPCTRQLQQARLRRDETATRGEGSEIDVSGATETGLAIPHEEEFPTVLTEFSSVVADTQQYMISSEDVSGGEQVSISVYRYWTNLFCLIFSAQLKSATT